MDTYNKKEYYIINILISLFPISIIFGTLAININTILIIFFGIYLFKFSLFDSDDKFFKYVIIIFFSYIVLISFLNYFKFFNDGGLYYENFLKSIFFLRYLLLFFVINKIIEQNLFNIKYFYYICIITSFSLGIDLIIQYNFGKDIFGFVPKDGSETRRLAGFFNQEYVAGSYLQKFSLFAIFSLFFFKDLSKKKLILLFSITSIFFLICIFISGNRMPFLLFLLNLCALCFIEKKLLKSLLISFFSIIALILIIVNTSMGKMINENLQVHFKNLFIQSKEILIQTKDVFLGKEQYKHDWVTFVESSEEEKKRFEEETKDKYLISSPHLRIFNAGVNTWKEKPVFGGGIKSFKINCEWKFNHSCAPHTHNYFIEVLADLGVIGLVFFLILFYYPLLKFIIVYVKDINYNLAINIRFIILPICLIIFSEAFPIRSSGSFFSTQNASTIFLLLPMLLNFRNIFKTNIRL